MQAYSDTNRESDPVQHAVEAINARTEQPVSVWYDYDHQAWVVDGKFVSCAHPASMNCRCYGRTHAGETAHVSWVG